MARWKGVVVDLNKFGREDWIVGGVALLTVIDLLFFPWFHFSTHVGVYSVSASSSATGAPDGWLGVLAMIAALGIVVDVALERLSPQTKVPSIGGSRAMTRFVLAVATAVLMALKFLFHIHFNYFGWGFYLGVVLVIALLYLTNPARQADSTPVESGSTL
jgi:hypothetical protein